MNSIVREIKADKKKAEKEKTSRRGTMIKVVVAGAVLYTINLVYRRTPFSLELDRLLSY